MGNAIYLRAGKRWAGLIVAFLLVVQISDAMGQESGGAVLQPSLPADGSPPGDVMKTLKDRATVEATFKMELLENFVRSADNQVLSLANSEFTRRYAREYREPDRAALVTLFHAVAVANTDYMQVRFLDRDGRERVRIDRPKNQDQPQVVPGRDMQDKNKKSYFQGPKTLREGDLWHSKVNLNMEWGKIEKPIRPTFRVSTPVFLKGAFRGVVVVNLAMSRILGLLGHSADFDIFVVDQDGEFIVHPDSDKAWSRYLPDRRGFKDALPDDAAQGSVLYTHPLTAILKNRDVARLVIAPKRSLLANIDGGGRAAPAGDRTIDAGLSLTEDERFWLDRHPVIRYAVERNWPPFVFFDRDNEVKGLSVDIAQEMGSKLGVEFVATSDWGWGFPIEGVAIGNVDTVIAIVESPERAKHVRFTDSYLAAPVVIVARDETEGIDSLDGLAGKRIGVVVAQEVMHQLRVDYPDYDLVLKDTVVDGLNAVSAGETDVFVGNLMAVSYGISSFGLANLKVAATTPYVHRIAMVAAFDQEIFLSILNKALAAIPEARKTEIVERWVRTDFELGVDLATILRWAVPIGGGAALLIILITLWNRRLGREIVDRKHAEARLQEAEERARLLLESVGEGVFGVDLEGRIVFVNPQAEMMLGFKAEEMIGQRAHPLFHHHRPDHSVYPVEECWMYKSFTFGESYRIDDEVLWCSDGRALEVEYNSTPIMKGQDIVGAVISFIDISRRRKAERELVEAFDVIRDSIDYATNIQRSLLPQDRCFEDLAAGHFVLWEPRDNVGGDLYWCKPWGLGRILALGDCTGHGVPGAFMTMIANGALEMALLETMPGDVGKLLQRVHQLIQQALGQHGREGAPDDGLELGVFYFNPKNGTMAFAGARISLFHVTNGAVTEIKGDRFGIGYRDVPPQAVYTSHDLGRDGNRVFYMTSDGLVDQIGGPKGRGFGKRRFKGLLHQLESLPMAERSAHVRRVLNDFQGSQRRRDDVSVLGFEPLGHG